MSTDPYQFGARARHAHRYLAASYAKIGKMVQARFSAGEWRKVLPWQQDVAEEACLAMAGL